MRPAALLLALSVAGAGCNSGTPAADAGREAATEAVEDRAVTDDGAGSGEPAPEAPPDAGAGADAGADAARDAGADMMADAGADAPGADAPADVAREAPPEVAPPADAGAPPEAGTSACGAGTIRWAARADYTIGLNDAIHAVDLGLFPDGDFVIAGTLTGRATFGHAPNPTFAVQGSYLDSPFVTRYAPDGTARWVTVWSPVGSFPDSYVFGAAAFADGTAVIAAEYGGQLQIDAGLPTAITLNAAGGDTALQPFLARVGADGRAIWAHNLPGQPTAVAAAADGTFVVAGRFGATAVFGAGEPNQTTLTPGSSDVFVARLAADGSLLWARGGGGPMNGDQPNGVAIASDGSVLVVGEVSLPATFQQSATAGDTVALPGNAEQTYFLARYAAAGSLDWIRGADTYSIGQRVALAPDGAIVTTGSLVPAASINVGRADAAAIAGPAAGSTFLARHDASGGLLSLARIGSLKGPFSMAVRDDGAVLLGGQIYGTGNLNVGTGTDRIVNGLGADDGYALCADPTGPVGWVHIASSEQRDNIPAIRVLPGGDALVLGSFTASVGIDRGSDDAYAIPKQGYSDMFVARVGR